MGADPYRSGLITRNPYTDKVDVVGTLVAILDFASERRGLQLIGQPSRAVRRGEVHELIVTGEPGAGPGQEVNAVAYLGFIEIQNGGIIMQGDAVCAGGAEIGLIAGFDETHTPNHQNIVIQSGAVTTGAARGLRLGERFVFKMRHSGSAAVGE